MRRHSEELTVLPLSILRSDPPDEDDDDDPGVKSGLGKKSPGQSED